MIRGFRVIVRFVDIGGIVDTASLLNFLFHNRIRIVNKNFHVEIRTT